jgi:hypothetical protein
MISFLCQWPTLFVVVLGALTGTIELVGRYRDAPFRAVRTNGAFLYIAVNVAAALLGLFFIQSLGSELITEQNPQKRAIYEVLIAGFGSLAFLRSSILKVRLNDSDVSIGPALLLDILLAAADRGVDRRRAADRAREVAEIMKNISFDKAVTTLPPFCMILMQNLSEDEQKSLSKQLKVIQDNLGIHPHAKSLLLGLLLMNFVGLDVVKEAAKQLGPHIEKDLLQPQPTIDSSTLLQWLGEVRPTASRTAQPSRDAAPP